jgi:excinuclease ABC subunit B
MQKTIDETNYRRSKQIKYNKENNITPTAIKKSLNNALTKNKEAQKEELKIINKRSEQFINKKDVDKKIREVRKLMEGSAKNLDFMEAAKYRDQIKELQEVKSKKFS